MGRPRIQRTVCAIEGCDRSTQAWNRCNGHYAEWRRGLPSWPIEHGTTNTYSNLKCRCGDCSAANSGYTAGNYTTIGISHDHTDTLTVPRTFRDRLKLAASTAGQSMRSYAMEAIEERMAHDPT